VKSFLLDVNVVLDVLLDREPHVVAAATLWEAAERKRVRAFLPAHGFTTVHYLIRRERGAAFAARAVSDLLEVFKVAPVGSEVLRAAMALRMPDFEDAVCAQSAAAAGCEVLVSQDPRGFKGSPVPVLSPAEAVALLRASTERE
jgi:predicted nucleic acid-binding protein